MCGQGALGGPPPLLASTDRAGDALVVYHRRSTGARLGADGRGRGLTATLKTALQTVSPKADLVRFG